MDGRHQTRYVIHGGRPQEDKVNYQSSWYDHSEVTGNQSPRNEPERRRNHVHARKNQSKPTTSNQPCSDHLQEVHRDALTDGRTGYGKEQSLGDLPLQSFTSVRSVPQPALLSHYQSFNFDLPSVDEAAAMIDSGSNRIDHADTSIIVPNKTIPVIHPLKLKPTSKAIGSNDKAGGKNLVPIVPGTASKKEDTIEALSAAISSQFNHSVSSVTIKHPSKANSVISISPSSVYTDDNIEVISPTLGDHANVRVTNLSPKDNTEIPKSSISGTTIVPSPTGEMVSETPTDAMLGLGIKDHTQNGSVVEDLQTRKDIGAARHAGTRSSTTSLSELIRRATKLASNLDRGKTASRLGLEEMLGINKKSERSRKVDSTYSDMLCSFPAPGMSTSTTNVPSPLSSWPDDEKTIVQQSSRSSRRENHKQRSCCGLSLRVFILVLVLVILLIAAAILIPIFLILVPQQLSNSPNLHRCSASYPCQNGGVSIIDNNACSCVCVNGFTGNRCATASDPSCTTATLHDGALAYNNATIGSGLLPILSTSQPQFNVSFNSSVLLSIFAVNNLSCAGENSFVQFPADAAQMRSNGKRRFFVPPFYGDKLPVAPVYDHGDGIKKLLSNRDVVERKPDENTLSGQSTWQATATVTSPVGSISPSPMPTSIPMNGTQTAFAQVVVLYVLEQSRAPQKAVDTQQAIKNYFRAGGISDRNGTLEVMSTSNGRIVANFAELCITTLRQ